jgi:hypothetical protein
LDCSEFALENSVENPNAIVPQNGYVTAEGNTIKANIAGKNFVVFKAKKIK